MYIVYTLLSTFLVSLFGSVHCLAMCGGFAAFCSGASSSPRKMVGGYHLGRGVAYATLGGLAGAFGRQINEVGKQFGVEWLSGFVVGVTLVASALGALSSLELGDRLGRWLTALIPQLSSAHSQLVSIATRSPKRSGFVLGVSSGFLPCGWLYTFVIASAGMGSAITGAVLMIAFWLGTLPILLCGGAVATWGITRLGGKARMISLALVLSVGVFSLYRHLSLPANVVSACH